MTEEVCEVCGLPIDQHAIILRNGVAHTIVPGKSTCSAAAGDREYTRGQIAEMLTIIRSLRYMAGRDGVQSLRTYSDIVAKKRDTLISRAQRWYPWGTL